MTRTQIIILVALAVLVVCVLLCACTYMVTHTSPPGFPPPAP